MFDGGVETVEEVIGDSDVLLCDLVDEVIFIVGVLGDLYESLGDFYVPDVSLL